MSKTEEDSNPYVLLGVEIEATDQEIRTAYRQRSLKVHPDRNPNNPDAARTFHELNQAYELLLDPLRRLALDAKLRVQQARKERFKNYDNKRKNLLNELEERERQFKKAKMEEQQREVERWRETERIKEEGRRLREEKEREAKRKEEEMTKAGVTPEPEVDELEAPSLGEFDTTVRLKYTIAAHPTLTTPSALSSLLAPFGETDTDSIVLSLKPPKKAPQKPPKYATALVPFKRIADAFAAVCASGKSERGLAGIDVGWVEGKEPPILVWLKKTGKLGGPPPTRITSNTSNIKISLPREQSRQDSSQFASFPRFMPEFPVPEPPKLPKPTAPGLDYESLTLMRMRQAERERLEREIREQEGED